MTKETIKKRFKFQNKSETLFVDLELKDANTEKPVFSASGTLYDNLSFFSDRFMISAGQCLDCIPEFAATMSGKIAKEKLLTIHSLWKNYHLNDLNADCEHGINEKLASEKLTIHYLKWNKDGERIAKIRDFGKQFIETTDLSLIPTALYEYQSCKQTEEKLAGWVRYGSFTPDGVLCKPCPVCGYKYGTRWNYRPIPEQDLKQIKELLTK